MAISMTPPGRHYDINRDEYYDHFRTEQMRAEQMHAEQIRAEQMRADDRQRQMYAAQQQMAYSQCSAQQQERLVNPAPKPDSKDPLSFLSKEDNKLLLTGETT